MIPVAFAFAVAAGLSLYAALAAIGLAAFVGLLALPAAFSGLAAPPVWGTLILLHLAETLAGRVRTADIAWNAVHLLVKPLGAALLASVALESLPQHIAWIGAAAAAAVALFVHLTVMGLHIASHTSGPLPKPGALAAVLPILAAGLGIGAILAPRVTALFAWLLLLAAIPGMPRFWTLAYAGTRALGTALWMPGRDRGRWETDPDSLPVGQREAVESQLGRPLEAVRSAPAVLARLGTRWPFYRGRLVIIPEIRPLFSYRRLFDSDVIELSAGAGVGRGELLLQALDVEGEPPYTLYVGSEAPPGRVILAALADAEGDG